MPLEVACSLRKDRKTSCQRKRTWNNPFELAAEQMNDALVDFFAGFPDSRPIFDAVRAALDSLGPVEMRVTRSQIAFRRRVAFAWVWVPDRYLHGGHAPLVLSVALRRRDGSPRWKETVEPAPGRFMHHLELFALDDIDDDIRGWLAEAWAASD